MRYVTFYLAIMLAVFVFTATDAKAADEVYRWVDENGDVHFSDQPPKQVKSEVIDIRPSTGIGTQPAENTNADADTSTPAGAEQPSRAQQQRDERAEKRKEDAEKQSALAAGCAQRYELVSQLEPSTRVMIKDKESGEVTRMDDNERLKVLGEAKDYISKNCKK